MVTVLVLALLIICAGCIYYNLEKREEIKKCKFKLSDIRVRSIGLTSADLEFVITICNPGDITATLSRTEFEVYGNGALLGTGKIIKSIDIPPHSCRCVAVPFTLDYFGAGKTIVGAIKRGGIIVWVLKGTSYIDTVFGSISVPFNITRVTKLNTSIKVPSGAEVNKVVQNALESIRQKM